MGLGWFWNQLGVMVHGAAEHGGVRASVPETDGGRVVCRSLGVTYAAPEAQNAVRMYYKCGIHGHVCRFMMCTQGRSTYIIH